MPEWQSLAKGWTGSCYRTFGQRGKKKRLRASLLKWTRCVRGRGVYYLGDFKLEQQQRYCHGLHHTQHLTPPTFSNGLNCLLARKSCFILVQLNRNSFKIFFLPWLVWLSGLSTSLWTTGSMFWFPVRAHAWVAGQDPSRGAWEATTYWCFSPSLPPFPSL